MTTLPLFTEAPELAHRQAFERWLRSAQSAGRLQRSASVSVYRDMWGAFTLWCVEQQPVVTLEHFGPDALERFQAARFGRKSPDASLTPRHALRLVRLIDRVLQHDASHRGAATNPTAAQWLEHHPEIRYADATSADPLPEILSVTQARRLILHLSRARPRVARRTSVAPDGDILSWQEVRNRTAVALQLGAGLTPGEIRALPRSAPVTQGGSAHGRPWKVVVPRDGKSPERETPIAAWAGALLGHWMTVRAQAGIQGEMLLPSTRTGKPWSKESHYKSARQVMAEAGLEDVEGGSFRLRHTFAVRQLRRGFAPEQIARWLGVDPEVVQRYERLIDAPLDVI